MWISCQRYPTKCQKVKLSTFKIKLSKRLAIFKFFDFRKKRKFNLWENKRKNGKNPDKNLFGHFDGDPLTIIAQVRYFVILWEVWVKLQTNPWSVYWMKNVSLNFYCCGPMQILHRTISYTFYNSFNHSQRPQLIYESSYKSN